MSPSLWYPRRPSEANKVTGWDLRAFVRAFGAALVGLVVAWLVTAASDEGQLTAGARAGRTLPIAPLCSAVGAAIALGTPRMRGEARALEGLGRSPAQISLGAALGGALPSIALGLAIATSGAVDVASFYPRPPRADVFVREADAFTSPTMGVRVADADGEMMAVDATPIPRDEDLPHGARVSASLATALAGLALALLAARSVLHASLVDDRAQRRRRVVAVVAGLGCALATLIAFQAAAARSAPAAIAIVPPALLLVAMLFGYRSRGGHAAR
jgi:hypothetical protein